MLETRGKAGPHPAVATGLLSFDGTPPEIRRMIEDSVFALP
jgi:hypothetical protein